MGGELEAAGAAATAGLVAGAIEGCEPKEGHDGLCVNCGAKLEGRFCHACGQPAHVHRSLTHLVEETLHGLIHFDTKTWRTLPRLAFRPGTLTRDFIDGKRARYVSPLALFLFTIFVMFATMAIVGGVSFSDVARVEVNGGDLRDPEQRAEALQRMQRERAEAVARGDTQAVTAIDGAIQVVEAAAPDAQAEQAGETSDLSGAISEAARSGRINIDTGDAKRDAKIRSRLENFDLLLYKVEQAAYKFAFLLIPISLPLIALLFLWKRGVTLFDHVVFSLYSLSFMSLFFLGMALLTPLANAWPWVGVLRGFAIFLVPPTHLFFHLKGAYQLGWFSAIWRTLFLLLICGVALLVFFAIIVMVGLFG